MTLRRPLWAVPLFLASACTDVDPDDPTAPDLDDTSVADPSAESIEPDEAAADPATGPALDPLLGPDAPDQPARAIALGTTPGPHAYWRIMTGLQDTAALDAVLTGHRDAGHAIDAIATTPTGHWVVVAGGDQDYSAGFPLSPSLAINSILASGDTVRAIDFNPAGGWVVVGTDEYMHGGAVPANALAQLDWYQETKNWTVRELEITNTGYVILGPGTTASYQNVDADLAATIYDRNASNRRIQAVEIGIDGRWAVVSEQAPATEGVSATLASRLRTSAVNGAMVSRLHVGVGGSYIVYSNGGADPDLGDDAERLEYDISGAGGNLWSRMAAAGVPGLQIALIENNEVVSVRSYGVIRASQQRPVIARTPFDLASLSKYLGSLVMVRLWADGEVDIDDDILDAPGGNLIWWNGVGHIQPAAFDNYGIPDIDLPANMTIRRLLTHRAGIRAEGGSPSVPSANWDELPLSTLQQLFGYTCSSSNVACDYTKSKYIWTDGSAPGGPPNYASGNFMLAQAIAEDAAGGTSAAQLQDLFDDVGLVDISGATPLAASFEARAAWQHGAAGAEASSRTVYPWTFAGGVYASAGDYAEMMILALDEGRDSSGVQRISASYVAQMLVGSYSRGLGLWLDNGNTAAEGSDRAFMHNGSHGNKAITWMCGNPTRGEGIVILANANSGPVWTLMGDLLDTYVDQRGWPAGQNCQ